MIQVRALFEPEMKWRLIEEYGIESFRTREDGRLEFCFGFMDKESIFGWMLSFGDRAELLEPENLRQEMKEMLEHMQNKYS